MSSGVFHHYGVATRLMLLTTVLFGCFAAGCNSDPRYRRESALMRAEILDIEDKYAALKSKYESQAIRLHELTGEPVDITSYSMSTNYHDNVIGDGIIIEDGTIVGGETIVSDGVILSQPHHGQFDHSNPQVIIEEGGSPILHTPQTQIRSGGINADPFGGDVIIQQESLAPGAVLPNALPRNVTPVQPSTPAGSGTKNGELPLPQTRSLRSKQRQIIRQAGSRDSAYGANGGNEATEVIINRTGTRGHDVDGVAGDEGLNLLVQTKDARGQVLLQAGELTVSIIDPKQKRRIGLWKFLPEETELFFVNDEIASDGVLLHLPWEENVPERSRLLVHVRFVTPDGRVLKTSGDVLIKPPGNNYSAEDPRVTRWTQRDSRWIGEEEDATASVGSDKVRRNDDWQRTGSSAGGAKFSRTKSSIGNPPEQDSQSARMTKAANNPDQPKWRPVR